jgi:hypothetical protein
LAPCRRVCCCVSRERFEWFLFWAYTCCFKLSPWYYDRLDTMATRLSHDPDLDIATEDEDDKQISDTKTLLSSRIKRAPDMQQLSNVVELR